MQIVREGRAELRLPTAILPYEEMWEHIERRWREVATEKGYPSGGAVTLTFEVKEFTLVQFSYIFRGPEQ